MLLLLEVMSLERDSWNIHVKRHLFLPLILPSSFPSFFPSLSLPSFPLSLLSFPDSLFLPLFFLFGKGAGTE